MIKSTITEKERVFKEERERRPLEIVLKQVVILRKQKALTRRSERVVHKKDHCSRGSCKDQEVGDARKPKD